MTLPSGMLYDPGPSAGSIFIVGTRFANERDRGNMTKTSNRLHSGFFVKALVLTAAALLALPSSAQELVDLISPTGGTITYSLVPQLL